jgi:hypothetical protein
MVGPISTLMNIRGSSQRYRGELEAKVVTDRLRQNGVNVIPAPFIFAGDAPLSWHLNASQKRSIVDAWTLPTAEILKSKSDIFAALGCGSGKSRD